MLWRQIFKSSFRLTMKRHAWNYVEWTHPVNYSKTVVPLALTVIADKKMTFLFDYSPVPGQVECSPRSSICIVSLNVLSLDLLPAVLALALLHFKFVFLIFVPRFQWIPAFPCAVKPSYFVPSGTWKHRKQKTAYPFKKTLFFCINLSLNALCSKSILTWNFPVIVWSL